MPAITLPPIEGMVIDGSYSAAPGTTIIKFIIDPDNPLTVERFEEGVQRLASACSLNGLQFGPFAYTTFDVQNTLWSGIIRLIVPWKFKVGRSLTRPYYEPSLGTQTFDGTHEFGAISFVDDSGRTYYPVCEWCSRSSPQTLIDDDRLVCVQCAGTCEECGTLTAPYMPICAAHAGPAGRITCVNCSTFMREGGTYSDYWDGLACEDCFPAFCERCDRETLEPYEGLCERCYDNLDIDEFDAVVPREPVPYVPPTNTEEYEEEDKAEADLLIPTIPGRENIRACGLEIEGGGNGRALARALNLAGLSSYERQLNYHTQTMLSEDGVRTWTVENDSSVDWEMVSPPLNIADRNDVRQLRDAVNILRGQIKEGVVGLDLRCGLHVHIGAERVGITHAYHLGKVWGFLEDVIFRLGAARWPYHRSIVNGLHYCQPTPKGAKTKLEFGMQMDNNMDRYNALSFQNYIQSFTRRCSCGAVRYDSWDECTCDLGKCTFEFRVFNTSANMHKIHAYLALCQALVAWATGRDEIDPDALPEQSYVNRQVDALPPTHVDAWKERLDFIFNELPLTEGEKRDLLYCVQHSELKSVGTEFIDALPLNAQEVVA